MKKIYVLFLGLSIILTVGTFHQIKAQDNSFDDEVLSELVKNAYKKLENQSYREKVTSLVFVNGNSNPVSTEITITEKVSPDREHTVIERSTAEGKQRTEYIHIGKRHFVRGENGEWKEIGYGSGSGIGGGRGSAVTKIERNVEKNLKKGELVENKITDYYEKITTTKFIDLNKTVVSIFKVGYWFDSNGLLIKSLGEFKDENFIRSRTTRIFEYDPNIKIEIPINDE